MPETMRSWNNGSMRSKVRFVSFRWQFCQLCRSSRRVFFRFRQTSEYYELIRLPKYLRTSFFVVGMSYHEIIMEHNGSPKFLCVSLYTCHALLPRRNFMMNFLFITLRALLRQGALRTSCSPSPHLDLAVFCY
jgi:hypothetical protein